MEVARGLMVASSGIEGDYYGGGFSLAEDSIDTAALAFSESHINIPSFVC